MRRMTGFAAVSLILLSSGALAALEDDQVRGEVIAIDDEQSTIQIRITESGDDRRGQVGSTQTYNIPNDVDIEYDIDGSIYGQMTRADLDDISDGDMVILDFEEANGEMAATRVRNEQTSNVQARERIRQQNRVVARSDAEGRYAQQSDRNRSFGVDRRQDTNPDRDDISVDSARASTQSFGADQSRSSSERTSLPSSASYLPLMAVFGTLFAGLGLALRRLR